MFFADLGLLITFRVLLHGFHLALHAHSRLKARVLPLDLVLEAQIHEVPELYRL